MFVESNHDCVNFSVMLDLKLLFLNIALTHNLYYFMDSWGYLTFDIVRTEPIVLDKLLVKQVLRMAEEKFAWHI